MIQVRGMIKGMVFIFLVVCFSAIASTCYAITPFRVAVMPPINTSGYRNQADIQILQDTIKKPFKFPYYKLLSDEVVAERMRTLLTDKQEKLSDEKNMAAVASTLDADIVIVVELSRASQHRFYTFNLDETYVKSDLLVKCYAYSAATQQYDIIKASKDSLEWESINTNPEVIFKELAEEILTKLPYKRIPLSTSLSDD